ncbi:hypothetical protein D9M73_248000 [compost metagenome]
MLFIQSRTASARCLDRLRLRCSSPVASVCPAMTISQPGCALTFARALISALVESGFNTVLAGSNHCTLASRTGSAAAARTSSRESNQ